MARTKEGVIHSKHREAFIPASNSSRSSNASRDKLLFTAKTSKDPATVVKGIEFADVKMASRKYVEANLYT